MARDYPYRFCPVCAAPLEHQPRYGRVRPVCPQCGFVHFCDPKVAAIALVERDGKVLLTRRAMDPARGRWTLPGGFVDCDEDPRQAAARECREETGLQVEITGLFDLYYGREHADGAGIIIVFLGEYVGGQLEPCDDVDAAGFFGPDELPALAFSSTNDILVRWQAARASR